MSRNNQQLENISTALSKDPFFAGFDAPSLSALSADAVFCCLAGGTTLFREGEAGETMYFVLEGSLEVSQRKQGGGEIILGKIGTGESFGEMQLLNGGKRTATIRAKSYCELLCISSEIIEKLLRKTPQALRYIGEVSRQRFREDQLKQLLAELLQSPADELLRKVASCGDWVHLKKGERLFQGNALSDSVCLVVSGHLQSFESADNQGIENFLRGDLIGEEVIITGEERVTEIAAIRNSDLVRFPRAVFREISEEHPAIMKRLSALLIQRLSKIRSQKATKQDVLNIALLPVHPGVQLKAFVRRLQQHLAADQEGMLLSSAQLDRTFVNSPGIAQAAGSDYQGILLTNWLDEQEARQQFILYEADPFDSPWTGRCLSRADHVLLVGENDMPHHPSALEQKYLANENTPPGVRRSLIILHPDGLQEPEGTRQLLANRDVDIHHHIRWDNDGDFARLGRILTGRAVGLVLSGGGARGLAHIGVIEAMKAAGIPIDMIGGTSMGAIIAAQHTIGYDLPTLLKINHIAFNEIKPFKEYTFPLLSLVRSRKLDKVAHYFCGDRNIEDLWINYFCVSSNLSDNEIAIHRQGPLGKMARASSSIPGVALPVLEDGKLLVDGGFFNNLPCDVMRQFTNGPIIAVKIVGDNKLEVDTSCQEMPSPWQMLWKRVNPFKKSIKMPNILEIMMRTMMLGSADKARVTEKSADVCLAVPLKQFGFMEFSALEKIVEAGYRYAKKKLKTVDWTFRTDDR